MAPKPRHADLRDAIRARGLRATPSRILVLELLTTSDRPISHGDVCTRLELQAVDPATLYRNLIDLTESGLARRTDVGDHIWRFELVRGDVAHPHFVCTECGVVECLPDLELVVPRTKTPRAIRQKQIEIHVRGLCDACA